MNIKTIKRKSQTILRNFIKERIIIMYHNYYINEDDIAMCCIETKEGYFRYFAMANKIPIPVNAAETLPGKAGKVSKEEFMKIANPDAVAYLERMFF